MYLAPRLRLCATWAVGRPSRDTSPCNLNSISVLSALLQHPPLEIRRATMYTFFLVSNVALTINGSSDCCYPHGSSLHALHRLLLGFKARHLLSRVSSINFTAGGVRSEFERLCW